MDVGHYVPDIETSLKLANAMWIADALTITKTDCKVIVRWSISVVAVTS